jgi:hypothetical protein
MTDSMTSEGWLKKTNFIEDGKSPIQATIRLEVPPHFKIVPLPSKIILWLTSLLRRLPQKQELAEEHMRTTLGRGLATSNTATASALTGTISLTECPDSTESLSWGLLLWLYVKGKFSRPGDGPLAKTSVEGSVNAVAATFQENGQEDPHWDAEHLVGQLL